MPAVLLLDQIHHPWEDEAVVSEHRAVAKMPIKMRELREVLVGVTAKKGRRSQRAQVASCDRYSPVVAGLLELQDLVEAAFVAAAFEFGFHPDADEPLGAAGAQEVAGEAEDVEVVVTAAELGRDFVDAGAGADAGELVGGDGHADAGAADQDAAVDFAAADFLGHQGREVGVVDAFVRRRAVVDHVVPFGFEQGDHLLLQVISSMITGDGNFHRMGLSCCSDCRQSQGSGLNRS